MPVGLRGLSREQELVHASAHHGPVSSTMVQCPALQTCMCCFDRMCTCSRGKLGRRDERMLLALPDVPVKDRPCHAFGAFHAQAHESQCDCHPFMQDRAAWDRGSVAETYGGSCEVVSKSL